MQTVFNVYSDPGHAWAKVPLKAVADVGLTEGHFTSYSYRRGDNLYLEEDGDLTLFIKALTVKMNGFTPRWRESHSNNRSKIRGYDCVRSDHWLRPVRP